MKKAIILASILLSACATTKVDTRIQKVYCVTTDQYKKLADAEPKKIGNDATGDLDTDYRASVKQNVLVRQYADGLLEVIGQCIGPVPQAAS